MARVLTDQKRRQTTRQMTKATEDWKMWGMQSDIATICNTGRNGKVRRDVSYSEQAGIKYVQ